MLQWIESGLEWRSIIVRVANVNEAWMITQIQALVILLSGDLMIQGKGGGFI